MSIWKCVGGGIIFALAITVLASIMVAFLKLLMVTGASLGMVGGLTIFSSVVGAVAGVFFYFLNKADIQ